MKAFNKFKIISSYINDFIIDSETKIKSIDNIYTIEFKFIKRFSHYQKKNNIDKLEETIDKASEYLKPDNAILKLLKHNLMADVLSQNNNELLKKYTDKYNTSIDQPNPQLIKTNNIKI